LNPETFSNSFWGGYAIHRLLCLLKASFKRFYITQVA
jgi:hypothetical protein